MIEDKKVFFDILKEHKEIVSWILEKQAELRAELLTFYKKDLKEIQSSLASISDGVQKTSNDFGAIALKNVQDFFIGEWKRSFNMISPVPDNKDAPLLLSEKKVE
jgi:hypothetical protein